MWALVTGALHEDGFADVADAFRAGRSRDKILAILKDSRIGAHGALALILISLLRWQALSANTENAVLPLATIFAVSRSSLVLMAWVTPPVAGGLGFEFSRALTTTGGHAFVPRRFYGPYFPTLQYCFCRVCSLLSLVARKYYIRRIGGVTGDCLGATCLIIETWGLISSHMPALYVIRHAQPEIPGITYPANPIRR